MLRRLLYEVGRAFRETGAAAERTGAILQEQKLAKESFSRHRTIMSVYDKKPVRSEDSFVAPSAAVVGDVELNDKSSVWYNAVVRGDEGSVAIGAYTNVQDRAVVAASSESGSATKVGNYVTIGHGAILKGCTVGHRSLIGMGAVVPEGCVVGENCIIGTGAVLEPKTVVPDGQLWVGNPAKFKRDVTESEREHFENSAKHYYELSRTHSHEWLPDSTLFNEAAKKS